jgi:hypothetical protein
VTFAEYAVEWIESYTGRTDRGNLTRGASRLERSRFTAQRRGAEAVPVLMVAAPVAIRGHVRFAARAAGRSLTRETVGTADGP